MEGKLLQRLGHKEIENTEPRKKWFDQGNNLMVANLLLLTGLLWKCPALPVETLMTQQLAADDSTLFPQVYNCITAESILESILFTSLLIS